MKIRTLFSQIPTQTKPQKKTLPQCTNITQHVTINTHGSEITVRLHGELSESCPSSRVNIRRCAVRKLRRRQMSGSRRACDTARDHNHVIAAQKRTEVDEREDGRPCSWWQQPSARPYMG